MEFFTQRETDKIIEGLHSLILLKFKIQYQILALLRKNMQRLHTCKWWMNDKRDYNNELSVVELEVKQCLSTIQQRVTRG